MKIVSNEDSAKKESQSSFNSSTFKWFVFFAIIGLAFYVVNDGDDSHVNKSYEWINVMETWGIAICAVIGVIIGYGSFPKMFVSFLAVLIVVVLIKNIPILGIPLALLAGYLFVKERVVGEQGKPDIVDNKINTPYRPIFSYLVMAALVVIGVVWLITPSDEGKAKKAVQVRLKDPDSAKFGEFWWFDKSKKTAGSLACLEVNARNSLGGYTGFQIASLQKTENGWHVIDISGNGVCATLSMNR